MIPASSIQEEHQICFLTSQVPVKETVRHLNVQHSKRTVEVTPESKRRIQHGDQLQTGIAISDGGCDTIVVGDKVVEVLSTTEWTMTMVRFHDEMVRKDQKVVSAATAVSVEDTTYILEFNESILLENSSTILLSNAQIREYGHTIDDVAFRHGRMQAIMADGVILPFFMKDALASMHCRRPTQEELRELCKDHHDLRPALGPKHPE